jgi:hypothetical protein
MAPEQLLGAAADARSDQFSFCVALFEALYGTRPFPAKDVRELAQKIALGELAPRPAAAKVPARLQAIIARGLRSSAAERFPSMQALLDELAVVRSKETGAGLSQRAIRFGAAIAVVVFLVAGGIGVTRSAHTTSSPPPSAPARPARAGECPRGAGLYCAGHGVDGAQATLYRCAPEGVSEEKTCAAACLYLIGGAVDKCDVDSPKCPLGNGLYCGGNHMSADPKTLYKCVGGTVMVEEPCAGRCVNEPDGKKDHCL